MKAFRIMALFLVIMSIFTLGTAATVTFTPSVALKDSPELVEGDEDLIVTPLKEAYKDPVDIHEDIYINLVDAEKELGEAEWHEIIEEFAKIWEEYTGGAPIDHAVISDIFDVRYESELGKGLSDGKPVTFKIKIQGITADDLFILITKENEEDHWKVIDCIIDENGIITINATSMSAFAVIRDNGADPSADPGAPDSPQTGVNSYFIPAAVGAVLFAAIAVVLVLKLRGRTA